MYEPGSAKNFINMSVQVAFILAGSTHAVYRKTLQHALGVKTVNEAMFLCTIGSRYRVVKDEFMLISRLVHGKGQ